jgi:tetratricopeptide (TPR) repeat protein
MSLPRSLRIGLAIIVAVVCVWGSVKAWQTGASRLLTHHGRTARLQVQTELAINKTPSDPEAHSGRAFVLLNSGRLADALPEYERTVALRPRDYFLWLELGRARDMNNDEQGALAALEQSVRLAPVYAQPRWQLGNVLFRAGRVEEAFREMRRAALSDVTLLPNFIDLAWGATDGDAFEVEQIVQPQRASWRIALMKYFIKRGEISRAIGQFRIAGGISLEDRQALLKDLLAAKRYKEAYEVWLTIAGEIEGGSFLIRDGSFESPISRDDLGFGWQPARDTQTLRVSLDSNNPHSDEQSLRLDFNGDSNPSQSLLTQLVLIEPNMRYRLSFAVRTEELVTGGLPLITVSDASSKGNQTLGQSSPFKQSSTEWQEYTVDFATGNETSAVVISLHRQNCSRDPCPIFGRLWLDDFVLRDKSADYNVSDAEK